MKKMSKWDEYEVMLSYSKAHDLAARLAAGGKLVHADGQPYDTTKPYKPLSSGLLRCVAHESTPMQVKVLRLL